MRPSCLVLVKLFTFGSKTEAAASSVFWLQGRVLGYLGTTAAGAPQLYTCVLKLVFLSVHCSRSARYAAWYYCCKSLPFQITKTSYRTCSLISCQRIAVLKKHKESNIDKVQYNTMSGNLFSCQRSNIPKDIIADLGNIVFSPPLSNIVFTGESNNYLIY